jgi:TolB-like protein/DNA-binding winged helix-turn-helix (wHTH) protein/Tfp pilus assembly protein PilF
MDRAGERIYRFAEFTLEASEHRLRRGEQEIYLRPKTFETLLYLVRQHGHLVKKDELLDTLWADTIVTESTLTHCIEEVRRALHDDAHHPYYIQTIPRVGYKFIAAVEESSAAEMQEEEIEEEFTAVKVMVTEDDQKADWESGRMGEWRNERMGEWANGRMGEPVSHAPILPRSHSFLSPALLLSHSPSLSRPWRRGRKLLAVSVLMLSLLVSGVFLYNSNNRPIRSLAVLPFVNLTGDPEQEYLADGMTEALITDLARLGAIRVISRTSAMKYKGAKKSLPDIARELRVDAIIEGSVLRSGEHIQITAQLIHATRDEHLWVQTYERHLRDILTLQREVSRTIAQQIHITLTPQEQARFIDARPVNPAAYEVYLKGRYYWSKRVGEGFEKAIEYFQQAIERDPNYALAYVGLADCYNMLTNYDLLRPHEAVPKARAAAIKALEIDNTLAEAHASLAFTKMNYDWDWPGAESEFQQALQLNPNYADAHHWYGLYLAAMGRPDEAMTEMKRARELDPLSLIINTNVGWLWYFARQYDEAINEYRKSLDMDPDFCSAHVKLGWAYEQQGRYAEAIVEFQTVLAVSPDDVALRAMLARAYALSGRRHEAADMLRQLSEQSTRSYVSPYLIALVHVGLGDNDQAFHWLEKSYNDRCGWLAWLGVDPKLDRLRADPRFDGLRRRVRLLPQ